MKEPGGGVDVDAAFFILFILFPPTRVLRGIYAIWRRPGRGNGGGYVYVIVAALCSRVNSKQKEAWSLKVTIGRFMDESLDHAWLNHNYKIQDTSIIEASFKEAS